MVWIIKVPLYSCLNSRRLFFLVNENQAKRSPNCWEKFSQNTQKKLLEWQKMSFLYSPTLSFNSNWHFLWCFVLKADCRHNFLHREIKNNIIPMVCGSFYLTLFKLQMTENRMTLQRSTKLLFNFIFFLHWIGAVQRSSFINQLVFVVVVVLQWKAAPRCRIHLRFVMVRYGLTKVLRRVKALQTRKTNLLMVLKTYSCKDLPAILQIF